MTVRLFFSWMTRLIYPSRCELCQDVLSQIGALCPLCRAELTPLRRYHCRQCAEPFDRSLGEQEACLNCAGINYAFDFVASALEMGELERKLVYAFKYEQAVYLAKDLGGLLGDALEQPSLMDLSLSHWCLVPVPLHPRRERSRHYNQADLLARALSQIKGLPYYCPLKRVKNTAQQARLSRAERLQNLKQAFALKRGNENCLASYEGVLLVDDVFTTGATVHECAKVLLREAGARRVVVLTLVRG